MIKNLKKMLCIGALAHLVLVTAPASAQSWPLEPTQETPTPITTDSSTEQRPPLAPTHSRMTPTVTDWETP